MLVTDFSILKLRRKYFMLGVLSINMPQVASSISEFYKYASLFKYMAK